MTPRQKLQEKVGKENADKWIKMVQDSFKPELKEVVNK